MTLSEFTSTVDQEAQPPADLSLELQALWYDKKGDWEKAHDLAQQAGSKEGDWVHAYLHRKEGDLSNARYWYNRAGRAEASQSLNEEWEHIVSALLE